MVKSKFALFEMQVKSAWAHSPEPGEAAFGVAPEALDAVDMGSPVDEFIAAMIDPEVLPVADIDEAVVAAPAVGIDDAFRSHLSSYNRLQRGFGAIRDNLGVDLPIAFEDTEDDSFSICATPSLALDSPCSKERFINFDLAGEGRYSFTEPSQLYSDSFKIFVNRLPTQTSDFRNLSGLQIDGKIPHYLPELMV